MNINPTKSNTDTVDLTRLSEIIAQMPGSTNDDASLSSGRRQADRHHQPYRPTNRPNRARGHHSQPDFRQVHHGRRGCPSSQSEGNKLKWHNYTSFEKDEGVPKNDPATGSHQSGSMPHWYPPYFYLPTYQYPYTTPLTHYSLLEALGSTSQPPSRRPPRSRPLMAIVQQENPENTELDRFARPIVERTD